jgi:hypothetical protein
LDHQPPPVLQHLNREVIEADITTNSEIALQHEFNCADRIRLYLDEDTISRALISALRARNVDVLSAHYHRS